MLPTEHPMLPAEHPMLAKLPMLKLAMVLEHAMMAITVVHAMPLMMMMMMTMRQLVKPISSRGGRCTPSEQRTGAWSMT